MVEAPYPETSEWLFENLNAVSLEAMFDEPDGEDKAALEKLFPVLIVYDRAKMEPTDGRAEYSVNSASIDAIYITDKMIPHEAINTSAISVVALNEVIDTSLVQE
jgi:hypothetical protein